MTNYTIQINPDVDSKTHEIIKDYWYIEKNKFPNTTAILFAKYSLTQNEVTKLVQDHSKCIVTQKCSNCENDFQREVRVKSDFKRAYRGKPICAKCEEESERIRREQQEEYIRKWEQYRKEKEEEMKAKFERAITYKTWLELNDFELTTLKGIVENKSLSTIKLNVFKGNFYDKSVWGAVNRLERLGLVHVVRNGRGVEAFKFDERLESHIYGNFIVKAKAPHYLSFSLMKNLNKKEARQPDYHGTFTLPTEIILKANEKYLSGAWIQTDGSITLKFTPAKDVVSSKQTRVEDEPKIIGEIIEDMYDHLGGDENKEAF